MAPKRHSKRGVIKPNYARSHGSSSTMMSWISGGKSDLSYKQPGLVKSSFVRKLSPNPETRMGGTRLQVTKSLQQDIKCVGPIDENADGRDSGSISQAGQNRWDEETLPDHDIDYSLVEDERMTDADDASLTAGEKMDTWDYHIPTLKQMGSAPGSDDLQMQEADPNTGSDVGNFNCTSEYMTGDERSMDEGSMDEGSMDEDMVDEDAEIKDARRLRQALRWQMENEEKEEESFCRAVDNIFPYFCEAWKGCGKASHDAAMQRHVLGHTEEHYSLESTYDSSRQNLGYTSNVGLAQQKFPRETGMSRSSYQNSTTLKRVFEGTSTEAPPKSICLHVEQEYVGAYQACSTKDTDSIIMFPTSLGAIRNTLLVSPVYDNSRNIQTSLHFPLEVQVVAEDGNVVPTSLEFKELPHAYFGALSIHQGSVLIGFPRLYSETQANNFLTKHRLGQFYDRILRPALHGKMLPGDIAYLPLTQELADIDARAKSREQNSRDGYRKQVHHFAVPGKHLGPAWDDMMRIIDSDPGLLHFKDPVLLVDIKNIKSETSDVDLYACMDNVDDVLQTAFDKQYIPDDQYALDLGSIVSPRSPEPIVRMGEYTSPGTTLLWRRCCVEHFINALKGSGFNNKQPSARIYTVANLWEIACLSLTPPTNCDLTKAGLRYIQLYGCVKTLFDAMGCYPFQGDAVSDICIEDAVFTTAASKANKTHAKKAGARFDQFSASKMRVSEILKCNVHESYGLRLEMRMTRKMWRAIKRRAYHFAQNRMATGDLYTDGGPEAAWPIYTDRFMAYLYGNYDKYTSLLEICSLTTPKTGRSLERTCFMRVVVQCIQQFFNCFYKQYPAMWVERKIDSGSGEKLYGLGFCSTLPNFKYAWFHQNTINWEDLRFKSKVKLRLAGHITKHLLSWYPEAQNLIIQHMEGQRDCMHYLQSATVGGVLEQEILLLLSHKLLRAYRGDVLLRLRQARSIQSDAVPLISRDEIFFSWDGLASALVDSMHAISGAKMIAINPQELFDWLWTDIPAHNRNQRNYTYRRDSWANLTYRALLKTYTTTIQRLDKSGGLEERFRKTLYREFFTYHWAIIYPSPGGAFISRTKSAGRQIWNVGISNRQKDVFYWNKTGRLNGHPSSYPKICKLPDNKLREHLRESLRTERELDKT